MRSASQKRYAIAALAEKNHFSVGLADWENWFDSIGTHPSLERYAASACAAVGDYFRVKLLTRGVPVEAEPFIKQIHKIANTKVYSRKYPHNQSTVFKIYENNEITKQYETDPKIKNVIEAEEIDDLD